MKLCSALLGAAATASALLHAQTAETVETAEARVVRLDDYLVETRSSTYDQKAPAVTHQLLRSDLTALNLPETGDALQHLPNLFIRKRFIGDKNALTSIRGTSNRQPGRTLVLADGVPLSNFLGTGFGNSPRWFLLAPEEIEKIAVSYGPYSALYAGNSIGGTILFTTAMPAGPSAVAKVQSFTQNFSEYGTHRDYVGRTAHLSVGHRLGQLSLFALYQGLRNDSHPMTFTTVNRSQTSTPTTGATQVTGVFADRDFSNQDRFIYGSAGPTEAIHDLFKVKLGYDLLDDLQLRYQVILWNNQENNRDPETYLRDSAGQPVWSGRVNFGDRQYTLPTNAFSLSRRRQSDLIQAVTLAHDPNEGLAVTATASLYDVLKDKAYASSSALPSARTQGPGQATIIGRTGWQTSDVWFGWRSETGPLANHAPAWGYHFDHYFTRQGQWAMSDWTVPTARTALTNGTGGDTRTHALFLQDAWSLHPQWTLTPGLRWESWRADRGYRERDFSGARVRTAYLDRRESAWSPKLALAWRPASLWQARLSLAKATRFPTVGELFQGSVSANGSLTQNDPYLKAEEDFAKDLTVERTLAKGSARVSLFEEDVDNALINQSTVRPDGTSFSGVQNVERVLTRGLEAAWQQNEFLLPSLSADLNASYTRAEIKRNPGLPSSVGKQFPRIPHWQVKGILTWKATGWLQLSTATRYSSYQYNTLDNSDPFGGYGGTDAFWVTDAKASFSYGKHLRGSVGVDNLTDDRYHVFHPMPGRTWFVELSWSY